MGMQRRKLAYLSALKGDPSILMRLHPDTDRRIQLVEKKLDKLEEFMNEAMSYMVFMGKHVRQRLQAMEEQLRAQRDQLLQQTAAWDTVQPRPQSGQASGRSTPGYTGRVTPPGYRTPPGMRPPPIGKPRPGPMTFS